jgi:cellulose synthase/poly-beta-1,6-N-acetylglucosamine synthase-like glycosyltransferase
MRVFFPKTIWSGLIKIDPDSEEQLLCNEIVNLAEDRILCLGIHKNKRDIVFMPDVFAQVEPVKMINDLMDQRQRTINGAQYSFERVGEELRRPDNTRQMSLFLGFQLFYMGYSKFLSTFAPALLLFTCHVTMNLV